MVGSWKDALDDLLLEGFRLVGRFSQPWGVGGHKSELVAPTTGRTTAPRLDGAPEISPIRKQPSNMGHLGSLGFPSQLRNSHS